MDKGGKFDPCHPRRRLLSKGSRRSNQSPSNLARQTPIIPEIPDMVKITIYGHFLKFRKFRKFLYENDGGGALSALFDYKELSAVVSARSKTQPDSMLISINKTTTH